MFRYLSMSFSFFAFIREGSLVALKRSIPAQHIAVIDMCLSRIDEIVEAFAIYTHEHMDVELVNPIIPPRHQYSMWLGGVGTYRRLCLMYYMQHILEPLFWDWPPSPQHERVYFEMKQELENMMLLVHPGQHIMSQHEALARDIIEVGCMPPGTSSVPVLVTGGGLFKEGQERFIRNAGEEKKCLHMA